MKDFLRNKYDTKTVSAYHGQQQIKCTKAKWQASIKECNIIYTRRSLIRLFVMMEMGTSGVPYFLTLSGSHSIKFGINTLTIERKKVP